MSGGRRGAAGWLLAVAVRLLPPARRDWGTAMRAELAGISGTGARWRFALGCLRAVARQPAVLRRGGYLLVLAGVLVAVYEWTRAAGHAPLRWALVGFVAVLAALAWLGARPGLFGPVAGGRAARLVRGGGYLLIGVVMLGTVASLSSGGNPQDRATTGVPILTLLLAGCLLGLLAVTGHRSTATGRVLATAAGAGTAAALGWTALVLAAPPVPVAVWPAVLALALGALAAGVPTRSLAAGLCAGTVAALLIVVLAGVLSGSGPARLVPRLAPAALTPQAALAQSRVEALDHYLVVLLLGDLLAVLLAAAVASRGWSRDRSRPDVGPSRTAQSPSPG